MPEKQAGLPSPSGRGRWVSRRFLPAQADPAQRSLSISHQRPHLPVLLLCRDLAAGSLGAAWGVTRSLLRVFHFKGKRRTRRRGGEAAGAESDCPFRAAALRRGDVCNSQASGGPGVIFKRRNATPQNQRKSGFSWKGHTEVSVLISKRHLLPAVEAALLETER